MTRRRFHAMLARSMRTLLVLLAATIVPSFAVPPAGVVWLAGFEKTLERAATEKRVVFLAVNMDGERANDRMVEKVYRDKEIVALAGLTLNLVACAAEHAPIGKDCPRFGGIGCQDHRRVDTAARKDVLKSDAEGLVVAPQHVFLGSDGAVILSVPYEITADELAWCFVTALAKADAASAPPMPASARSPKRLIVGATYDPSGGGAGSLVPPTKAEVGEILARLKKGLAGEERMSALRRLVLSDEPDAIEHIGLELKSSGGGFGGGGGGGGPGGGGRGGDARHALILRAIGNLAPPTYWELVADFLGNSDPSLRREAAVALEQLAAPQAAGTIAKELGKEKDPLHQKDLVRALGACGAADAKARATLLARARKDKQIVVRRNALVALGWSAGDPDVRAHLRSVLESGDDVEREAAALAAGLSRDPAWKDVLATAAQKAHSADARATVEAAGQVLEGGALALLREHVVRTCGDEIPRERIFGRAPGGGGR